MRDSRSSLDASPEDPPPQEGLGDEPAGTERSAAPLEIKVRPGVLPETWDRTAVFFANLLSLFFGNEEETRLLRENVGRIETYGGRLIPIVDLLFRGGGNLLVLEKEPVPELIAFLREELGLDLPEVRVVPHSVYTRTTAPASEELAALLDELNRHPAKWIDGFVTDEVVVRLAELTGKRPISTGRGSREGNDKSLLQDFLERSGLPVFDTFKASGPEEGRQQVARLGKMGYRQVVIKAPVGASGIGMIKVDAGKEAEIPPYLFHAGACLVQGWFDDSRQNCRVLGSPSVQVFVGENTLSLYDLTDQILSGDSIHQGNVSPPRLVNDDPQLERDLLDQAAKASAWLHGRGYRGTASVDFLLTEESGKRIARICEINARVTGATYPSLLARHFLPAGAWQMRNVLLSPPQTPWNVLRLLRRENLLYAPGKEAGMFPFNFNPNSAGLIEKCQLLALAPDACATTKLFEHLKRLDQFAWDYDRD